MAKLYDHRNSTYVHMLDCIMARLMYRLHTPNQLELFIRDHGWIALDDVCGWRLNKDARYKPIEDEPCTQRLEMPIGEQQ